MSLRGARSVLMVCTGNICRSPTMEAIFRAKAQAVGLDILFDSAGTESFHTGEAPDPRSQAAARQRGYELSGLRARQVRSPDDFISFDRILAADLSHLRWLEARCPAEHRGKLSLLLRSGDLPDPYYGEESGFHAVLDAVEAAAARWLAAEPRV